MRRAISDGVDDVVDTIIRAELEIDPILCDKETRRWLQGKVDDCCSIQGATARPLTYAFETSCVKP